VDVSSEPPQVNARKHTQLERLPPVLVLQLKRFGFEGLTGSHKLNKYVPFPLRFQLPPDFLAHPNVPQRSAPTLSSRVRLLAMLICFIFVVS